MSHPPINLNIPEENYGVRVLREAVGAADADWGGVQCTIDPLESTLLVISRKTNETLLVNFNSSSFKFEPLVAEIKKRLAEHHTAFENRKIYVQVAFLSDLRNRAAEIGLDIDRILGGKSGKANS